MPPLPTGAPRLLHTARYSAGSVGLQAGRVPDMIPTKTPGDCSPDISISPLRRPEAPPSPWTLYRIVHSVFIVPHQASDARAPLARGVRPTPGSRHPMYGVSSLLNRLRRGRATSSPPLGSRTRGESRPRTPTSARQAAPSNERIPSAPLAGKIVRQKRPMPALKGFTRSLPSLAGNPPSTSALTKGSGVYSSSQSHGSSHRN